MELENSMLRPCVHDPRYDYEHIASKFDKAITPDTDIFGNPRPKRRIVELGNNTYMFIDEE